MYRGGRWPRLVEALRYKPEGRGFDSQWDVPDFYLTSSFRPHNDPGVDSDSLTEMNTRNILLGLGDLFGGVGGGG